MSGDNSLRELFPSSERIAIGGSDPRGTNTIERYQNALIRYGKQSFGIYWEVFRDLEIIDDFVTPYKLSEADKRAAKDDKFIEKDLFNLIDSSKKIVDDFKNLKPKMTAFVLQSITPAGEEKIKERYRPEWTKAINEDDFIGLIKLISLHVIQVRVKLPSLPTSSSLLKITEISPIRRVQPSRSMPTNCTY